MTDNVFEFKKPTQTNTDSATSANARLNPIVVQLKEALTKEFGNNITFAVLVRRNDEPQDDPGSKLAATNLTMTADLFHLLHDSAAFIHEYTNAQLVDALNLINTINTKPVE